MVKLLKVHGSENTFFLFDLTQFEKQPSLSSIAKLAVVCQKSANPVFKNIDGILVVTNSTHPDCLGKMIVINADGSRASMCGNGLRTVTRYLAERYQKKQFHVETDQADLAVTSEPELAPNVPAFGVEIGPIRFNQAAFPFANLHTETIQNQPLPDLDHDLRFSAIAVPNPHLISFVSKAVLQSDRLEKLGTRLNSKNQYFPDGVNVSFATILGENRLFVRTFERGVGFTNACGTGMSATSLAYAINQSGGDFDRLVTVFNPGGMVKVHAVCRAENYQLQLIANATTLGYITIPTTALWQHQFNQANYKQTNEETAYQAWVKAIKN
ncbi:diaminopimelate epimerase [Fructilactobacillus florum]|uniref:Diaminopimelate epimerase n=1 Tax=Fructilactobacillus florum DSM 22689 = JCM 16035 TaxID=1423745 RepID=A0A0R2CFD6_9LACO|nr:diaminopimelate epimerase [Fructilactobacillus florum]KRM89826.1 Diaminopimelate epimerase [Fructilactobacillus florum DSM 22689 = JCM 16035]